MEGVWWLSNILLPFNRGRLPLYEGLKKDSIIPHIFENTLFRFGEEPHRNHKYLLLELFGRTKNKPLQDTIKDGISLRKQPISTSTVTVMVHY